jgi:hypothetical protein
MSDLVVNAGFCATRGFRGKDSMTVTEIIALAVSSFVDSAWLRENGEGLPTSGRHEVDNLFPRKEKIGL